MIKITLRVGFRLILSFSLIFVPTYSYSNFDTFINHLETAYEDRQEEIPAEFQEASQILREMGAALMESRLKEYIDARPELKSRFDILSLSHQQVEVLDYAERSTFAVHFDQENSSSIHSYKRILQNIDIDFNEEGKLVFKGVVVSEDKDNKIEKKIGLIHTFHDVKKEDVVDWAYDKELLVILHKRRGLILYHTIFASELMGSAPIPSINLPVPGLLKLQNVQLEFIDRAVSPPIEPVGHSGVAVNLDGKPMFSAGDLLITHNNSKGEKTVARILSRSKDLTHSLFRMYIILDSLIQIRSLSSRGSNSDQTNSIYLERRLTETVQTVLSATINRHLISFFNQFSTEIGIMPYFLLYKAVHKNPDMFLHTEWYADYQKINESHPKLFEQRSNVEGTVVSSADIVEALQPVVSTKKEAQKEQFQSLFSRLKKKYPKISKYLKEHKFFLGVFIASFFYAGWESYRVPHIGEHASNLSNTIYDMVFLGVGVLLTIYISGRAAIPFLKSIRRLPLPGELKLTIEQIIEKWGKDHVRVADKLAAFGYKVAAILLPIIYRAFQVSGQHHLFSALQKGVNPFQKVTPDSSLGRSASIDQSLRLYGLSLPPLWKGGKYEQREQLIDLIHSQKQRVERLSRIMAYYAVSGQPFDVREVLTGLLSFNDNIDYKDKKLMRNINWISQKLSQYILESKEIDTNRPLFEWINNDLNKKALELAKEVKNISWTQKQIGEWKVTTIEGLRRSLAWNTEQARILMSYYPTKAVADVFWQGLILDHLILVTLPLTELTPRGDFYSGSLVELAIEPHSLSRASGPHLHEAFANGGIHVVQSARQELQYLTLRKYEKLRALFEKIEGQYGSIEEYLNPTKNEPTVWQYLGSFGKYPFQWGQKIYEGTEHEERVDPGFQAWKSLKIMARFWVVTLSLMFVSRMTFASEYSLISSVIGTLYFAGAGMIFFGLPQLWAIHHHLIFDKKTTENKKNIDEIKLIAHKIEKGLYTSSDLLDTDYERALYSFKKLYYTSKKFQKNISLDQIDPIIKEFILQSDFEEERLREFIQSQTLEEKREQIRAISLVLNTRYLPTLTNLLGYQIAMLLGLGIWSNILFVYVSKNSFGDVTIRDSIKWLVLLFGSGYVYNRLSAKSVSERIKDIKRGVKAAGVGMKRRCSLAFRRSRLQN